MPNPSIFSLIFWLFLGMLQVHAQERFFPAMNPPEVWVNEVKLSNPWAGGLNFCQLSTLHLNDDSISDIWIFDRSGNRNSAFIGFKEGDSICYKYDPKLSLELPELQNWVLIRDFDGDGWKDIFTSKDQGIQVWKRSPGIFPAEFTLVNTSLRFLDANIDKAILVAPRDLPAIGDVDEDGDVDILTFDISGSFIEYYKNQSVELFGHSDSLLFVLEDACWGKVEENPATNEVSLEVNCSPNGRIISSGRHAGSTVAMFDLNDDDLKDLVLGDISFDNLVLLVNGGTLEEASIISQLSFFPQSDESVSLDIFPGAFFEDIDQDGFEDLIVSPNGLNVSENKESIWYYRQVPASAGNTFQLVAKDLFQSEMIELGEGAYPVFYDIDQDGDNDLIAANFGVYDQPNYKAQLSLFKYEEESNRFNLVDDDWLEISQFNLGPGLYPAFGDINGDGRLDILLGKANGELAWITDTTVSADFAPKLMQATFQQIDIGGFATPQLIDLNEDDLLDLVIGERNGNLNLFLNQGDKETPLFRIQTDKWGGIDVGQQNFGVGYSVPFVFKENGEWNLIVGSFDGNIYHYSNVNADPGAVFDLLSDDLLHVKVGVRTAASWQDLDKNGQAELVVGNYAGGFNWFEQATTLDRNEIKNEPTIRTFPNPTSDFIIIHNLNPRPRRARLIDLQGKVIRRITLIPGKNRIDLAELSLSSGIYLLKVNEETTKIAYISD